MQNGLAGQMGEEDGLVSLMHVTQQATTTWAFKLLTLTELAGFG
jgi:hypothetical protein